MYMYMYACFSVKIEHNAYLYFRISFVSIYLPKLSRVTIKFS